MSFKFGEKVLLNVYLMKGFMRFGKKGKLNPRYISLFEVLDNMNPIAYSLALPPSLSGVHPIFYVSMTEKYRRDGDYILKWV